VLLAPAGHPLAKKKAVDWDDLRDEPFLVLHEMHCLAGQVERFCRPQGVRPPIAARGAQLATIAEMVAVGLGISVAPAMMQAQDRSKHRVYRPFASAPPARDLCLATALLRYRTNAARAFMAITKEVLAEQLASAGTRGGR